MSSRKILAISGSLRGSSKNTTLLRAAQRLAPADVELSFYEALGDVPPRRSTPTSMISTPEAPRRRSWRSGRRCGRRTG